MVAPIPLGTFRGSNFVPPVFSWAFRTPSTMLTRLSEIKFCQIHSRINCSSIMILHKIKIQISTLNPKPNPAPSERHIRMILLLPPSSLATARLRWNLRILAVTKPRSGTPLSEPARLWNQYYAGAETGAPSRNNKPPVIIPKPCTAEWPFFCRPAQFRFHRIVFDVMDCLSFLFLITHEGVPIFALPLLERRSPSRRVVDSPSSRRVGDRRSANRSPALRMNRFQLCTIFHSGVRFTSTST